MLKSKSLYHLIIYSILFIIVLVSAFTFIIINNTYDDFQEKILFLKQDFTDEKKELIKNDVNSTINFIKYYQERFKHKKPTKEIQKEVLLALSTLHPNMNENNYIFIYDFKGLLVYHPILKKMQNKNLLHFKDPEGKEVIKELINISKNRNGGYIKYLWPKKNMQKDIMKISYANSFNEWNWLIGKGVYLEQIDLLIEEKEQEYQKKISNYTLQIISLTIMLILYSLFIYRNATILIVRDVKEIGKYFKESQEDIKPINQNRLQFGEFKIIANYAKDAMNTMKLKSEILKDLNKNLEFKVTQKTSELTNLIESQKTFLKYSVHEINTPLSIIRTNIDLLKMKTPNNTYINHIESGAKIIQYIYDDLSYMIKKDRIIYNKEYLNFSEILKSRVNFFTQIAISNDLHFISNIEDDMYLKFNLIELQRVIDNNLSNAIKYSYTKSPIYINLEYISDDEIQFLVKTHSKKIEYQNKIFDDFYRENNARGGFGLGLKIVKDICDKNSVIIRLSSTQEETKFMYRFKINENIIT